MYYDHFGLYTAPFSMGPHLQFVFKSNTFEETMAHLVYGIEGGEPIILITGEIGTGKTLALHNLTEHISKTFRVALVNVTQINFRELLKLFVAELGMTLPPESDRADLLGALKTELEACRRQGQRLLLIVDEAHNLDAETLEGVRLLTNLGPASEQILQVVLSGQPALHTTINGRDLIQLRQRIRVHYHLESMTRDETERYISHRLQVAGADKPLFKRDAMDRVHEISHGVPRVVNIIADRALLAAYVDGKDLVAAKHVEEDPGLAHTMLRTHEAHRFFESAPVAAPPPEPEPPVAPLPQPPEPEPPYEPEPQPEPESPVAAPLPEPEPKSEPEPPVAESSPPESPESLEMTELEDLDDDIDEYSPNLLEQAEEAEALADETDPEEEAPYETLHREPDPSPESDEGSSESAESVRVFDETSSTEGDDTGPEPGRTFARPRARRRSPLLVVLLSALIVSVLGALALGVVAYREGKLDVYLAKLGLADADSTAVVLPAESVETRDALAELADSLETAGGAVRETPLVDEAAVAALEPDVATDPRNDAEAENAETSDFFSNVIDTTRVERPGDRPRVDSPVTAPEPAPEVVSRYPDLVKGRYYIHVGSLKTLDHAEMLADSFQEKGHPVAIRKTLVSSLDWFRVYVGPFDTSAEAERAQSDISRLRLLQHNWSQIVRIR